MEHETRFELAFPSRSSISHTRRSLSARVSPFRWHALNRKGQRKTNDQSSRIQKEPATLRVTSSICSGARDQIRTGVPFEVCDLSYSSLAKRSRLPLPLAMLLIERLNAKLISSSGYKKSPPCFAGRALFVWSTRPDSNWRPSRWQRDALPAELLVHQSKLSNRASQT